MTVSFFRELESCLSRSVQNTVQDVSIRIEVASVMEEMLHDVEVWDQTVQRVRVEAQVAQSNAALEDLYDENAQLKVEKQDLKDRVEEMGEKAKGLAVIFRQQLQGLMKELTNKAELEAELQEAKASIEASAALSRNLAQAQREIREMRRKQSLQALLNPSYATSHRRLSIIPPTSYQTQTEEHSSCAHSNALLQFKDEILLLIFTGLDATDIVSTAMSCKSNGLLIHRLFGMPTTPSMAKAKRNGSIAGTTRRSSPSATASTRTQGSVFSGKASIVTSGRNELKKKPSDSFKMLSSGGSKNSSASLSLSRANEIVNSMKPAEMKLFHDMSTRMRYIEGSLGQIQAEKEDLAEKLQGTESVKDFLMEKLKEVEDALTVAMDENEKLREKQASDHEVIGFLDGRVQDLERNEQKLLMENENLKLGLEETSRNFEKRIKVVEDMSRMATLEKADLESHSKSQKKVLVREVKTLRMQQNQLIKERDAYKNQLLLFKKSLMQLDSVSVQ